MKKKDLIFIAACAVVVALFFVVEPLNTWFMSWSKAHDWRYFVLAFLKFGVLATVGECIGLRISKGGYNQKGFGIMPRALVWGVLGVAITIAMCIFSSGTFNLLSYFGLELNNQTIGGEPFGIRLLYAACVSVLMNTFFAPVFMTIHKMTDTHILATGGTLKGFFSPIPFGQIFENLNWKVQWNFVFMKTIPFFLYPAHTITFLLPPQFRVLFAALLGVALGIILSISNMKKK